MYDKPHGFSKPVSRSTCQYAIAHAIAHDIAHMPVQMPCTRAKCDQATRCPVYEGKPYLQKYLDIEKFTHVCIKHFCLGQLLPKNLLLSAHCDKEIHRFTTRKKKKKKKRNGQGGPRAPKLRYTKHTQSTTYLTQPPRHRLVQYQSSRLVTRVERANPKEYLCSVSRVSWRCPKFSHPKRVKTARLARLANVSHTILVSLTSEVCLEFEWQYYLKRKLLFSSCHDSQRKPRHMEVVPFRPYTLTVILAYVIFPGLKLDLLPDS